MKIVAVQEYTPVMMKEEDGTVWRSSEPTDSKSWEYYAGDTWEVMDDAPEITDVYNLWVKQSCQAWLEQHSKVKK